MTLIPQSFGERLRTRARKATAAKLENYIELRDFIAENEDKILEIGWMEFYKDAGDWMDCGGDSVRKSLTIIRNYPDDTLRAWIAQGISFDHIETANSLQNIRECQYAAADLLDRAVEFGNGEGKRMTVEEMTAFALGERPPQKGFVSSLFERLINFPNRMKWDVDKSGRFQTWIDAGREFFDA
jgi:hypothetical protein